MTEWFEKESFWKDFYDYLFPPQKFKDAEEEIEKILNLTDIKGKDVLDLCCGPARHSAPLAKRNYSVTGVDKSQYLLNKAKKYCADENVNIRFIENDMRDYLQPNSYDLILNLFTSFGYFADKNDDMKVVRNIYKNLRKSGKFIIELMGKEILARIFQETSSTIIGKGVKLIERRKILNGWSKIENEWILLRNNRYKTHKLRHRIYSAEELKNLLEKCKFKNIQIFGNLDGSEYNNNAERLIIVAEK